MKNYKVRYHDDAIRQMLEARLKSRFIRKLHVSPKRIARINKGLPANNPGAPAKFKDYHKKFVVDLVLANPYIKSSEIRSSFESLYHMTISAGTVSTILKTNKIFYGAPIKIQKLTDYQIIERFNFSSECLNQNEFFFQNIVFTDESKFSNNPDFIRIYRLKGDISEKYTSAFEKYPVSVMVWGAIAYNFKSELVFFESTVNSDVYLNMLKETKIFEILQNHFKSSNFFFEQDGASCHFEEKVLNYIFERSNLVCGWPANSPDLSPIEMMWAIVKFRISRYEIDQKPSTKAELISAIKREWDSIDIEVVNRLVLSFRKRLELCIHLGGNSIGPYLKYRNYDISKIEKKDPPLIFNDELDSQLFYYYGKGWKKTGEILNINKNLVKYRTNCLIRKKRNDETPKLLLTQTINTIKKIMYPIPQINNYYFGQNENFEELEAIDHFPLVTYIDDEKQDSDYDSD